MYIRRQHGIAKPIRYGPVARAHALPEWQSAWDGLLARYMFWEGGGFPRDVVNRNNVTSQDGDPTWVVGPEGLAIRFDGAGDHLNTSWNAIEGTAARTTVVSFRTSSSAAQHLIGWGGDNATASAGAVWRISIESGDVFIRIYSGSASWTLSLDDGALHTIAVSVKESGTTSDIRLVVDGVDNGLYGSGSTAVNTRAAGGSYVPLTFGEDVRNGTTNDFDGDLIGASIYDYELPVLLQQSITRFPFGPFRMARSVGVRAPVAPAAAVVSPYYSSHYYRNIVQGLAA